MDDRWFGLGDRGRYLAKNHGQEIQVVNRSCLGCVNRVLAIRANPTRFPFLRILCPVPCWTLVLRLCECVACDRYDDCVYEEAVHDQTPYATDGDGVDLTGVRNIAL